MNQFERKELERFINGVRLELEEMARLDVQGAKEAIRHTEDKDEMYDLMNMKVSDCASLLIDLG